eukprot:gb/GFBE01080268.1/.p2 GENE.gb/GFBE01080268.1/~~gb/GFBE01080268.1/.p2  ORF type:complete len:313 (-),score=70.98 gb/GFBE01080268.1/:40-978(-)
MAGPASFCGYNRLTFAATTAALLALASSSGDLAPAPLRANEVAQVSEQWNGATVNDLFREYNNIFRHGNRNAASHLWVRFLLERSEQMTQERLEYMFSGFCAVSGSPVRPSDYNRYKLTLDHVDGSGKVSGFMHYCCWPCVCDTQDFIRVDTRNVTTSDGVSRSYNFAVIGNPCDYPEELQRPFADAFGRGMSMLQRDAPEVRCGPGGELIGAPLSDHGYVIIAMFFKPPVSDQQLPALTGESPQPGRISEVAGVKYQDEWEYAPMCEDRKQKGFNSGMGEIFRKVAAISPVIIPEQAEAPAVCDSTSSESN